MSKSKNIYHKNMNRQKSVANFLFRHYYVHTLFERRESLAEQNQKFCRIQIFYRAA